MKRYDFERVAYDLYRIFDRLAGTESKLAMTFSAADAVIICDALNERDQHVRDNIRRRSLQAKA